MYTGISCSSHTSTWSPWLCGDRRSLCRVGFLEATEHGISILLHLGVRCRLQRAGIAHLAGVNTNAITYTEHDISICLHLCVCHSLLFSKLVRAVSQHIESQAQKLRQVGRSLHLQRLALLAFLIAIRVELQCAGAPIADKLGVRPMSSALSSTARIASAFQALCAPLLEHCLLAMTSAGTCRDQQGTIDIGISRSIDGGCSWEPMRVAMQRGEWGGLPRCFNVQWHRGCLYSCG